MKRAALAAAGAALLTVSCTKNLTKDQLAEIDRTAPVCTTEQECEIAWSAARQWLLNNSGYKLQHVTDDFMETYNSVETSPRLAVRVQKVPLSQAGHYKIAVDVWCANPFGCRPPRYESMMDFNHTVADAL